MWIFLWLVMIGVEVAGEWIEEKWNGDGTQNLHEFCLVLNKATHRLVHARSNLMAATFRVPTNTDSAGTIRTTTQRIPPPWSAASKDTRTECWDRHRSPSVGTLGT